MLCGTEQTAEGPQGLFTAPVGGSRHPSWATPRTSIPSPSPSSLSPCSGVSLSPTSNVWRDCWEGPPLPDSGCQRARGAQSAGTGPVHLLFTRLPAAARPPGLMRGECWKAVSSGPWPASPSPGFFSLRAKSFLLGPDEAGGRAEIVPHVADTGLTYFFEKLKFLVVNCYGRA